MKLDKIDFLKKYTIYFDIFTCFLVLEAKEYEREEEEHKDLSLESGIEEVNSELDIVIFFVYSEKIT